MSPQIFAILSSLIEEKVGLHYDLSQIDLLSERVGSRASEAGFDSLLDYYYYLRYDAGAEGEIEHLVERLVVGETYFFRERRQLEVAVSDFLEEAVKRGERPRVWSAACASGEEILSIAMMIAQRGLLDRVDLVASDISAQALAKAKSGRFPKRSMRDGWPPEADLFLTWQGSEIVIDPRIIAAVKFQRLNLLDPDAVAMLPSFDVILCRNVLIYFRDATVARAVETLSKKLRPGGALFVGISESLLRFETTLACEERGGIFLYRNATS
ncbi:MAG: CheR family methyltransferase [Polyangiaceae bacterium]